MFTGCHLVLTIGIDLFLGMNSMRSYSVNVLESWKFTFLKGSQFWFISLKRISRCQAFKDLLSIAHVVLLLIRGYFSVGARIRLSICRHWGAWILALLLGFERDYFRLWWLQILIICIRLVNFQFFYLRLGLFFKGLRIRSCILIAQGFWKSRRQLKLWILSKMVL